MLLFCRFIFQALSQHCVTHMDLHIATFFFLKTNNSSIPFHLSHLHKISFPLLHCSRVAHSCLFSLFSLIYFLFISIKVFLCNSIIENFTNIISLLSISHYKQSWIWQKNMWFLSWDVWHCFNLCIILPLTYPIFIS